MYFCWLLWRQKAYKLYDPVARKVIIIWDVQFFDNESWDETFDINVKIMSSVDHDDMTEEVVQTPHVSQPVATPLTPMTPWDGPTQGTSTQFIAQATSINMPR